MKISLAGICAAFVFASTAPALAQVACPAGTAPSAVRVSTIKPAGSMEGFRKAATDHLKWYRDHGYKTNEIITAPVMETTDRGKTWAPSRTQVLSIHRNDPGVPQSKRDTAWRAYVDEYRANSDITTEVFTCLPR
ncbi:MAG TPA: hypothetical protein VHY34_04990 [Caulobacteraceae bacterium]|jgi:hypothetical protein|nr:hypothetical protein [Caulobacteraceae bacterium]